MTKTNTKDGTEVLNAKMATGRPIPFSPGWPLAADARDGQTLLLADHGYRAVAHDPRGNGRSGLSMARNDMNAYADDLPTVMALLYPRAATHAGRSTGGCEAAHYPGRQFVKRVGKEVAIGAVSRLELKGSPLGMCYATLAEVVKADQLAFSKA